MKKIFLCLVILAIITLLASPNLDQQIAILPFEPVINKFYGEVTKWCSVVYYGVNVATFALITVPLILFFLAKKTAIKFNIDFKRMLLISYISLAIGPGLIVNSTFKNHWGRARPYQVLRDHHPFSLPWQPHFNRPADNSFPSGHVSIGAFIGIPFIAARRRKLGIALCALGFTLVGIVRWLQGGHYFTDIVMAGLIVWMVNVLVTYLVDKKLNNKKVS